MGKYTKCSLNTYKTKLQRYFRGNSTPLNSSSDLTNNELGFIPFLTGNKNVWQALVANKLVSSLAHYAELSRFVLQRQSVDSAFERVSVNSLNLDHAGDKVAQDGINKTSLYRQLVGYSSQLTRLACELLVSLRILYYININSQSDTLYRRTITGLSLPTKVTIGLISCPDANFKRGYSF